jgi:hypothetical protein
MSDLPFNSAVFRSIVADGRSSEDFEEGDDILALFEIYSFLPEIAELFESSLAFVSEIEDASTYTTDSFESSVSFEQTLSDLEDADIVDLIEWYLGPGAVSGLSLPSTVEDIGVTKPTPPPVAPPAGTGVIYCMNAVTLGISRYTGIDAFNVVAWDDQLLILDSQGLKRQEGDSDNGVPIAAALRTGAMHLGGKLNGKTTIPAQDDKHMHRIYLTGTPSGSVRFTTYVEVDGEPTSYEYVMSSDDSAKRRTRFKNFGRGVESPYWSIEMQNVDGGPLDFVQSEVRVGASRRLR